MFAATIELLLLAIQLVLLLIL